MIAKITRGARVGDIGAYVHGPGTRNEHRWIDRQGREHPGGIVIGSNIGAEGQTDCKEWAADLRHAHKSRASISKPIWQCSLRAAPQDPELSDAQWADAAQTFAEQMGFADCPWVAVRHGDDHIHIIVSRVNDVGEVWAGSHDRRHAQRACTQLEQEYGLRQAPRRKERKPQTPQPEPTPQQPAPESELITLSGGRTVTPEQLETIRQRARKDPATAHLSDDVIDGLLGVRRETKQRQTRHEPTSDEGLRESEWERPATQQSHRRPPQGPTPGLER